MPEPPASVAPNQFNVTLLDPSTIAVSWGGGPGAVVSVLAAEVVAPVLPLAAEWFCAPSKARTVQV
jgi:hypothetical protein